MRDAGHELELHLVGRLRLVTRQGSEVKLRSSRIEALIALLGTAPDLRRTRSWLQDKLWSESSQELGSASLRQVLTRLRHVLGTNQNCLVTDGVWVGLDPQRVRVSFQPAAQEWELTGEPPEFAAGLDIKDPEFEDWLRDQRSAFANQLEEAPPASSCRSIRLLPDEHRDRPILILAPGEADRADLKALADIITDEAGAMVAHVADAEVSHEGTPFAAIPSSLSLCLGARIFGAGDRAMVQFQLRDPRRGEIVWNARRTIRLSQALEREDGDLECLVSGAAAAATFELTKRTTSSSEADMATALGYKALRLFSEFDASKLAETDRLFDQAWQRNPAPVFLAWRSYVAFTAVLERVADDPAESSNRAVRLGRQALALDPFNPVSASLASDVISLFEGRMDEAHELALRAASSHPSSPFARASLAYRRAWLGDVGAAYQEALSARALSTGHFNLTWWDIRCFIAATRAGRYDEAIRFAEAAHERSPTFRPPLRFLAALKYARRDEEGALKALTALKQLEPDFSLDLFASDLYPIHSLRSSPLMEIARSGLM